LDLYIILLKTEEFSFSHQEIILTKQQLEPRVIFVIKRQFNLVPQKVKRSPINIRLIKLYLEF